MDSGQFEPYIRVGFVDTDPDAFREWVQPVEYILSDTEAYVVVPNTVTYFDGGFFAIRRGVIINGVPEYTTTTSFYQISTRRDERFFYMHGTLLPKTRFTLSPNLTWQQAIDSIETYIAQPAIEATYELPSHAVWDYQFYPTGRSIIFNNLQSLPSLFRQKFLIFPRHTENTYTFAKTDIYFYQPTESRATDYTITDLLYNKELWFEMRCLIWRDDANTTHVYNPFGGSSLTLPIHNLGYIPTTGTHPAYAHSYRKGSHSSKLSPNLKYESGDVATIITNNDTFTTRIKVTEYFKAGTAPAWYIIIEPATWFDNTEGGALPSTIEAATPYTPLNTSYFNGVLSDSDNNIQAAMETLDDHDHGMLAPVQAPTATNDFLIGAQVATVWTWVKNTLAQTITVLRTSLDSIYAAINGWTAGTGTWSYSSADSPTFVISINADVTALIGVGQRIKLTQTTVKYFIVTAVGAYSGGATLVTVYGGTDYTLANAAITSPYYSNIKAPFGFPLSPDKWSVSLSDTSDNTQATPTQNTWYQPGSLSIAIPIGVWSVRFSHHMAVVTNAAQTIGTVQSALSTSTSSASDADLISHVAIGGASGTLVNSLSVFVEKVLTLTSKTTYNLNLRTTTANVATIGYYGSTVRPTRVTCVSAYL